MNTKELCGVLGLLLALPGSFALGQADVQGPGGLSELPGDTNGAPFYSDDNRVVLSPPAATAPGDFDHDCDVDRDDFTTFQSCASGPAIHCAGECAQADLDSDGDADQSDFAIFQRCYSGEGNPADPNCNGTCSGEACDCLCGQSNCDGTCRSIQNDPANCGSCGNACSTGRCEQGVCVPCPPGMTVCSGVCVYLPEDNSNCGCCGNLCPSGTTCMGGLCQLNDPGGGEPTSISSGSSLRNAVCPQSPCSPGYTLCCGTCVNTASDSANCGACGNVCPVGSTCMGGVCSPLCDPNDPFSECYCGVDHPYSPNCCPGGQTFCSGGCSDTYSDDANCGTCGNVCPAGSSCVSGVCVDPCQYVCCHPDGCGDGGGGVTP